MQNIFYNILFLKEILSEAFAWLMAHGVIRNSGAHAYAYTGQLDGKLNRFDQAAGDEVVIVTATNEFVTRPIATAFGVKELIAVELVRDAQGEFTGEIAGTPSFREGKVARVQAWLAARQLDWHSVETVFYSDSINDLPLLEKVTHPVATNPDAALRAIASERQWRILELFT